MNLIGKPRPDKATSPKNRKSSTSGGVGARAFWSFASEALKGPDSRHALCREFLLEPAPTGQDDAEIVTDPQSLAGAKLVLGRTIHAEPSFEDVRAVAATQRWALTAVAGLAEAQKMFRERSKTANAVKSNTSGPGLRLWEIACTFLVSSNVSIYSALIYCLPLSLLV